MDIEDAEKPPEITRQRIDYEDLPDGDVKAILTITLPGGIIKRFEAISTREELEEVQGEIVAGEYALRGDEVGFSFGKLLRGVGKIAKGIASSKVFKLAAAGLAFAAPLLGPIAPMALAASAGMGVASKLAKAGAAAASGAVSMAQSITKSAARDARRLTTNPMAAASLLADANRKRLGAERVAFYSDAETSRSVSGAAPLSSELVMAAREGRVRSSTGQIVNALQLRAANNEGRVILWVK